MYCLAFGTPEIAGFNADRKVASWYVFLQDRALSRASWVDFSWNYRSRARVFGGLVAAVLVLCTSLAMAQQVAQATGEPRRPASPAQIEKAINDYQRGCRLGTYLRNLHDCDCLVRGYRQIV